MNPSAPTNRKRAISETAQVGPSPDDTKRLRRLSLKGLWVNNDEQKSIEDLVNENVCLKALLAQFIRFVDDKGLVTEVSANLRALVLSRLGPKSLAKSLQRKMATLASPLYNKSYNYRKTGVTNDDLAGLMVVFLKPIQSISQMEHEDALEEAYKLAFQAKSWWFNMESTSYLPDGCTEHDTELDELITDLIDRRKEAGHTWAWKAELERLEAEAKDRADMGTEKWLVKSRQALKALVEEFCADREDTAAAGTTVAVMASGLSDLDSSSESDF
ncbi:hypothetical protein B0T21DRAFT_352024 [Apiosordaria backusii]|uniref:Uncharacterized protein n=1 Tax=Apiosordaria backusii TaxID=314023 RepID=A0AA40AIQ5_9PEZI|nr:hypothetical protein B0T21DRAFT_352024 [Apiosordaria backusii]